MDQGDPSGDDMISLCVLPQALKRLMDQEDHAEDDTIEFQQILRSVENSPDVRDVLCRIPRSPPVSWCYVSVCMVYVCCE